MAKQKKVYCCSECGEETANWAGKCPSCGAWNTLVEFNLDSPSANSASYAKSSRLTQKPKRMSELDSSAEIRFTTGISELDRVLGGGAVQGSLVLVGGAPGIGKSTLLLQMCGLIEQGKKILYVTGEESERQLKLRAGRLNVNGDNIFVLPETDILVMALPSTAETVGILSRERIALLPDSAFVVNVGRGTAIDQEALCDALNAGQLAGAALDVVVPEPLPADHPLRRARNLLLTPHVAGNMTLGYTCDKSVQMFCDDLENYAAGRPLAHLVDRKRCY